MAYRQACSIHICNRQECSIHICNLERFFCIINVYFVTIKLFCCCDAIYLKTLNSLLSRLFIDITLRKLVFNFFSNLMGHDPGDSFPIDSEPNGFPFGSENRKKNGHHDHIPFNLKGNGILVFCCPRGNNNVSRKT